MEKAIRIENALYAAVVVLLSGVMLAGALYSHVSFYI